MSSNGVLKADIIIKKYIKNMCEKYIWNRQVTYSVENQANSVNNMISKLPQLNGTFTKLDYRNINNLPAYWISVSKTIALIVSAKQNYF